MSTSIPRSAPADHRDSVRAVDDRAAHLRKAVAKSDVALQTLARKSLDRHSAARDRRRRQKITGRRGVGLDRRIAWRDRSRRGNRETAAARRFRPQRRTIASPPTSFRYTAVKRAAPRSTVPKATPHRGAAINSPLRNWLDTSPRTVGLSAGQTGRHRSRPAGSPRPLAAGVDAELAQSVQQILDRPFAHARRAVQAVSAVSQGHQRRQKTDRRAAVGHVQFGRRGRQFSAATGDVQCFSGIETSMAMPN